MREADPSRQPANSSETHPDQVELLPIGTLMELANGKASRLKQLSDVWEQENKLKEKKEMSAEQKKAHFEEEDSIRIWFEQQLGEGRDFEDRVEKIGQYMITDGLGGGEEVRNFFEQRIVEPLKVERDYEMTPEQKKDNLEWLKEAAKRGVVVQQAGERQVDRDPKTGKLIGKRYPYSDSDGNNALRLMWLAGVIDKDTPVHYVKHEEMYTFLENNPRIGIVIDISEESLNKDLIEAGQPHRDSLVSRLGREDTGEKITHYGRVYFEHHGSKSHPNSGCSTVKVYNWLRQLDALPAPEISEDQLNCLSTEAYMKVVKSERNRGIQIKHIVDFVDAQDDRNYYPAPDDPNKFDIEQTLTNAFGLKQARVTDDTTGKIINREWWGDYQPGQVAGDGYRERFLLLMALTGRNYKRQFDPKLLSTIVGIKNPDAIIANSRQCIIKARDKIQQWRQEGRIEPTPSGGEIFIDQRNWVENNGVGKSEGDPLVALGVDGSDMLISEGIRSRMITGLDKNGDIQSITAFAYHDPAMMEKFIEMQRELGGQVARNSIYNFRAGKNT